VDIAETIVYMNSTLNHFVSFCFSSLYWIGNETKPGEAKLG